MKAQRQSKRHTVRNVIIFTILTVAVGWLSIWLNGMTGSTDPQQSPGMLLWLVTPLAISLSGDDTGLYRPQPARIHSAGRYRARHVRRSVR